MTNTTTHPLEGVFDIEPGTTVMDYQDDPQLPTVINTPPSYDEKDQEIDEQFQEVYDLALDAYKTTTDMISVMEPKFRARNEEVAANYLTLALSAARDKANLKLSKDKIEKTSKNTSTKTVNNNIFTDRETLLRMLDNADDAIDGTFAAVNE